MTKKVKIGSSYFDIEYCEDLKGETGFLNGRIIDSQKLIQINAKIDLQSQHQTIIHESTHGICWDRNLDSSEETVEPLGNGIYSFIIDNIKLIEEIIKHTKRMKA